VIIAISTPIDTTPYGFEPQDPFQMGIENPGEERGWNVIERGARREISSEMPLFVFPWQEQSGCLRNIRKGLEQNLPEFLPFTDDTNIKTSITEEEIIIRGDLRSAQNDRAGREKGLELFGQIEASFDVPLVTAHSHQAGLSIHQELENGLVAAIRHQMVW
jgi:hypothetical protein